MRARLRPGPVPVVSQAQLSTMPVRVGIRNNGCVSDLIDTTEMYLRTIYELVEEGIVPLRARIAERLHQSGPTVSQTVARMERDGLLTVEGDRHLQLTEEGNRLAVRVMRKHRLAEHSGEEDFRADVVPLDEVVVDGGSANVMVRRISEEMQKDESMMGTLRRVGALPDKVVRVARTEGGLLVGSGGETAEVDPDFAAHVFVRPL